MNTPIETPLAPIKRGRGRPFQGGTVQIRVRKDTGLEIKARADKAGVPIWKVVQGLVA